MQICILSVSPGGSKSQLYLANLCSPPCFSCGNCWGSKRKAHGGSEGLSVCAASLTAHPSGPLSLCRRGARGNRLVSALFLISPPQKTRFMQLPVSSELVAAFCHCWQRGRDYKGSEFQQDLWSSGAGWMTSVSPNLSPLGQWSNYSSLTGWTLQRHVLVSQSTHAYLSDPEMSPAKAEEDAKGDCARREKGECARDLRALDK